MRTHGAIAAAAAVALGCFAPAQEPVGLAAILAEFPDHDAPELLLRLRFPEGRLETLRSLREIGRPAHEALLGFMLCPDPFGGNRFPLPPSMEEAFGDFDGRAAWTLPVLIDLLDRYDARDCVLDLLGRLGPAAAPATTTLRALGEQVGLHGGAARKLLKTMADEPAEQPEAPRPPSVPAGSEGALLAKLTGGPSRFPTLQALVALGDEAAAEAALVLLRSAHKETTRAVSVSLLAWLRYVYRARGALDLKSILLLPEDQRTRELRRHALAGVQVLDLLDLRRVMALGDPGLDRLLALRTAIDAQADPRHGLFDFARDTLGESSDPEVRRLLRLARRASSPADRDEVLDTLRAALGSGEPAMRAAGKLGQMELDEVHDDVLPLVVSALDANHPIRTFALESLVAAATDDPARLGRILELAGERHVQTLLHRLARASSYSREVLVLLAAHVDTGQVRSFSVPAPSLAAADLFALLRDPATRSGALRLLDRATYQEEWAAVSGDLAPELIGWMPELDESQRNTVLSVLLRLKGKGLSALARLCREGPVELRRNLASRLAWNPIEDDAYVELMSELAQDADLQVAARALDGLRRLPELADAGLERLNELWEVAENDEERDMLVWVTGQYGEAAAGLLPRIEQQFAREDPVQRALAFAAALRIRPGHERGTEMLREMLRSDDLLVRQRAFSVIRADLEVMDAFVPEILLALDSGDQRLRFWALRALEKLPGRWPELRRQLEKWSLSNDSMLAQTAKRILDELDKK